MLKIRPAVERGLADLGWLHSRHSFSFASYNDPEHMGFGPLRVINEDQVQPGKGFDTHGHQDMEIISYVIDGALQHRDSMGTGSIIRPGDVQRMTAGTGVRHSEFNASKNAPVHFLQIWILPERRGLEPSYEQKTFSEDDMRGQWRLIGSRDGGDGSITIHQDVNLYATVLRNAQSLSRELPAERDTWLQMVRGAVTLDGRQLSAGDGVAIRGMRALELTGRTSEQLQSEVLLFDMGN